MSNYLVTGGAGFIGSHLVIKLLEDPNNKVVVLDRLDSTVDLDRLAANPVWISNKDRREFIWWDLKSPFNESIVTRLAGIDTIIHCASQSHVSRSIKDPIGFILDNVLGTGNLLEYIRNNPLVYLIHVSSDEVLGSALEDYAFTETDTPHPENPYSSSKLGQEALVRAYVCTYGIKAIILRFSNIIGTGQNSEKALPLFIQRISNNLPIQIHTSKTGKISTRYYLDIQDLMDGLVKLLDCKDLQLINKDIRHSGVYHFSGNKEISNYYIAQKIAEILGKDLKYEFVSNPSDRFNPDIAYRIDDSNTRKLLNWEPEIPIDNSLKYIINFYKTHPYLSKIPSN